MKQVSSKGDILVNLLSRVPRFAHRIAILCSAVCVCGAPSIAQGAGVVGTGTAASCTDAAFDDALAGGGLVTFNCGGPAIIESNTKNITVATTVDGGGLITISGVSGPTFNSAAGIEFAVHNLTIVNSDQWAISTQGGSLIITHSVFTDNNRHRSNIPGAIVINGTGTLNVSDSSFTGNGGGIVLMGPGGSGSATITNSTFADNDPGMSTFQNDGGAIFNFGWTLTVANSTFIGNRSGPNNGGGGIGSDGGTLTVINCTFSGNSGGGIAGAGVTITNSIFSGNTDNSGNPSRQNCAGTFTDGGHNLDDGTSCGFSAANGSLSNTNPQLDPAGLQNNGGPTETVALCTAAGVPAGCTAASPAIDAGNQSVCAAAPVNDRDQRDYVRPGTGQSHCSIGAYEADAMPAGPCIGDCDGSGMVEINELILGVNIDLGAQPVSACSAFANAQGKVDIAQLIKGVKNALNGCS
jgi:hypothetical protein